jgi:uncharacterized repeat protein (TIGR02543 family)
MPVIQTSTPIVIPWDRANTNRIGTTDILTAGSITAIDAEDTAKGLNLALTVADTATGKEPSLALSQPGVHQLKLTVKDTDDNTTEMLVAVVVQDGNFLIDNGYILRGVDFDIDIRDVATADPIKQIGEQGDLNAWRNDGTKAAAAVTNTGGYRDAAGVYHPIIGIYDQGSAMPSITVVSKNITATVTDDRYRHRVTFDANGGTLIGPSVITITEPATELPYLPASPVRDGYTFRYWTTDATGSAQFTAGTSVTGDMTVYAIWDAIPAVQTPPAPVTPPPSIIVNTPPAVGGPTYTIIESSPTPSEGEETVTLENTQTPLASLPIAENTTPLVSDTPTSGWSLFNLLMTVLAALLLAMYITKRAFDHPWRDDYEEERRPRALHINALVLIIAAGAFIESLVILFLTQNFGGSMTSVVDSYSVIFALAVFVQVLAPLVAAVIRSSRLETKQLQIERQPAVASGDMTM